VVSVTRDGGASWTNVTPAGMTQWSRVSQIDPSHFDAGWAYASVERHRADDQTPYIYRTKDFGKTWQAITNGLAAPAFVNAVREDPQEIGLLFAGTEFGMYVSFNDGANWQPLQLNLPVTSVRDMVIHGDDLVVATHGRGFYILDNITPLRQIADRVSGGKSLTAALLFAPQLTYRIDSDAFPGTPLPPEEPTAENPPAGAMLDYFLPAEAKAVELNIYDRNHKLIRHVSSAIPAKASHMDLPIADRWFPAPQRLETASGHHRFIWNLAVGSSGVAESDEPDDGEGGVPRGPKVAPGEFTIELGVDGKPLAIENLEVDMDPRSAATPFELQQNFATATRIFGDSLDARRALAEIESVKGQIAKTPGLKAQSKTLLEAIEAISSGSGGGMGLEQANTELTSALNVVESSDRAIPSQALEIYSEAKTASAARVKEWSALKEGPLAKYNLELKAANLPPIAISLIEREVYTLMTQ
jgi:hypothetical protein